MGLELEVRARSLLYFSLFAFLLHLPSTSLPTLTLFTFFFPLIFLLHLIISSHKKHFSKLLNLPSLISVIFRWFLLSSYLLKLLVFLYFFWFDLIFIYIYLFICALKEWEDFRLIYKDFTCKVGLGQLSQVNLHPARHKFKRRPTQLNQSLIRIRIPTYTSVRIFGITFISDI